MAAMVVMPEGAVVDLWWLRSLLDSRLLLGLGGGLLFGSLVSMAFDQWLESLEPRTLTAAQRQLERKRLLRGMRVGVWVISLTGLGMAIIGLWFTQSMSIVNLAIALLVVAVGTIVLLAPPYALYYAYFVWKWRLAE